MSESDESKAARDQIIAELLPYFDYAHLPAHLQEVSRPFGELAYFVIGLGPVSFMMISALRKLLESKDAAVRARLFVPPQAAKKEGE